MYGFLYPSSTCRALALSRPASSILVSVHTLLLTPQTLTVSASMYGTPLFASSIVSWLTPSP